MNVMTRLLFSCVVVAIMLTAIVAQRWTVDHREEESEGPFVMYTVGPRLSRVGPGAPIAVSRAAQDSVSLSVRDALRRASNETAVPAVIPAYLPTGFTPVVVHAAHLLMDCSDVSVVFRSDLGNFTLSEQLAPACFDARFALVSSKPLEMPGHQDTFAVSEAGPFVIYSRRTPTRSYGLFMGPSTHPLTQQEALKVLVSLPSR